MWKRCHALHAANVTCHTLLATRHTAQDAPCRRPRFDIAGGALTQKRVTHLARKWHMIPEAGACGACGRLRVEVVRVVHSSACAGAVHAAVGKYLKCGVRVILVLRGVHAAYGGPLPVGALVHWTAGGRRGTAHAVVICCSRCCGTLFQCQWGRMANGCLALW